MAQAESIGRPGGSRETGSAIGKAFKLLWVLRRSSGPLSLTRLAEESNLAPSSAHSVLLQLLAEGAVAVDDEKRYTVGPAVFYLGASFSQGSPVYRATWVELIDAANELGVTAALAVPWENHHLILNAHRAGRLDVAVPVGGRVPIDASSWGKAYYGWSGSPVPTTLSRYTDRSVTDATAFAAELEEARRRGYATDCGEFDVAVGGVCAPVTGATGFHGLAAFLGPIERVAELSYEQLGTIVAKIAARASLSLGDDSRFRIFGMR